MGKASRILLVAAVACLLVCPRATAADPKVARAQQRLSEAGFDPGPIDGIWGARTRHAVASFQRAVGLPVTGKLDARTMAVLEAPTEEVEPAPPPAVKETEPEPVVLEGVLKLGRVEVGYDEFREVPVLVVEDRQYRLLVDEDTRLRKIDRLDTGVVYALGRLHRIRGVPGAPGTIRVIEMENLGRRP